MNRRNFLKHSAGVLLAAPLIPKSIAVASVPPQVAELVPHAAVSLPKFPIIVEYCNEVWNDYREPVIAVRNFLDLSISNSFPRSTLP